MRQKKYAGRRIFAMLLALMLSLNTVTAYAAADIPETDTVSETSEISAGAEDLESVEAAEATSETETEAETEKQDGSSETAETAEKEPAASVDEETSEETGADDAALDGEVSDEEISDEETSLEEETAEEETDSEELLEEDAEASEEAVEAFLNAAASIEVPEEDLLLEENAALAESFGAVVWEAFGLYEALSEEQQALEKVEISFLELQNMAMILPDYAASAYATSNVVVNEHGQSGGYILQGVQNQGGSIIKNVDESGFYQRRAVKNFYCPTCGWFFGQSTGKEYVNIHWNQSVDGVIKDVSFKTGVLDGYQCLQMDFTGATAGTTLVTLEYDVNFHTRWNSGYANCPWCSTPTSVQQYDDSWYHYTDTFYVTVESLIPVNAKRVWYVYVPTNGAENGSATIELNAIGNTKGMTYYKNYYVSYTFDYDTYMPMRNIQNFSDPSGINGNYANITQRKVRFLNGVTDPYGVELSITGLDTPTPEGKPISIFLTSEWPYGFDTSGVSNENIARQLDTIEYLKDYKVGNNTVLRMQWNGNIVTDEIRIVVYEPETVTMKKGESYTHNYGEEKTGEPSIGWDYVGKPEVLVSDNSIINESHTDEDYYVVSGKEAGISKVKTTYTHFGRWVGYNKIAYPRTTYVDVVNYKVVKGGAEDNTPVTIVKEFNGITAEQIPDDFQLNYQISGCSTHSTSSAVTLSKDAATLTVADGIPRLSWNIELPVAVHGNATHTINFTENNTKVEGYKTPTMLGASVKLEDLETEAGANRPVITVTNQYELEDNVFELFYDFNGGTDGPATQVYKGTPSETSHDFNVAGGETPAKIPVNGEKVFKGWSETLSGDAVYAYNSKTKTYTPATVTVTKNSGENSAGKTLYAVWEEYKAPEYNLTGLEKVRIKSAGLPAGVTLPDGVKVNDDDTVVFLGDNPGTVTLLYKITVNGTAGAAYKVTDSGAEWVSGGSAHEKDSDNNLIITGTIEAGKTSAEIYVTKTFAKDNVTAEGKLINEADLDSNDAETTEGPADGSGSGSADASKKYNVTINFKTDDETPETLQDSSTTVVGEGEGFGFGVDKAAAQRMARRNAATAATVAISVPYTITKNGKTYILDEIASEDALNVLRKVGENGVTADIVKDLIYSLDMKGGSDSDKEEGGSDGIPDKYQAKIAYQATEGGNQNGVSGYVTIKDADDVYGKEGTAEVSAKALAKEGYYFSNWTAAAAGDEEFTYSANVDPELSGTIEIKGGAVYTFTANFAKNGTLTITADSVEAVYDGAEHPVTPDVSTGEDGTAEPKVTVTYIDAEGNESEDAPKDAGTYTAVIKAELAGYDDAELKVTVEIARRGLTVNTASDSKTYDGTPLTNSTAVVTVDGGAVAGEEITAVADGSRTEVGSAVNTYTINWGKAKESNYEVTEVLGTLTVNAAASGGDDTPEPAEPENPTPATPVTPATPTGGGGGTPDPAPATPVPAVPAAPAATAPAPAVTPVAATPVPAAAPAAAEAEEEGGGELAALEDEATPLAAADTESEPELAALDEEEIPLAGGEGGSWALFNFALMNLAIFESLMLLIGWFVNAKNDNGDGKKKTKKKGIFRVISLPIAIISLIVFILTEDITLPTAFVDKYTVVMLILAIVQTVMAALSNKKYEDGEEA